MNIFTLTLNTYVLVYCSARLTAGGDATVLSANAVQFSFYATLEIHGSPAPMESNACKLLVLINGQPLPLLYPSALTAAGQRSAVPSLTLTVQSGVRVRVDGAEQSRVLVQYVIAGLEVDCSLRFSTRVRVRVRVRVRPTGRGSVWDS